MSTRLPPLHALKVFETAARHLSFKKAAEELCVTPAAVSHQLSHLEGMLGVRLFDRFNQAIQLTAAGRACLPKLQEGLECLRDSVEAMRSTTAGAVINVSSSPSFAAQWLFPRLHRFVLRHPDIDVQVSTRMGPFIGDRIPRGAHNDIRAWAAETDVVIALTAHDYPALRSERLMSLSISPLCSPRFYFESSLSDDPASLAGQSLIHDDRGTLYGSHSFWQRWLAAAGLADRVDGDRGVHFTHAALALGAAEEGMGIVASTPALVKSQLASGRLMKPFDLEVPLESSYQILCGEVAYRRADVAAFRAWLHSEASREVDPDAV